MKHKIWILAAAMLLTGGIGWTAAAQEMDGDEATSLMAGVADKLSAQKGKFNIAPVVGGISVGWIDALDAPAGTDISMGRSVEVSWLYILGLKVSRGRNALSIGLGVDWRNYRVTGDRCWTKQDGKLVLTPYTVNAEGPVTDQYSRIKTFALQIPVMYTVEAFKDFRVSAGGILNFVTHSSILTGYKANDVYTRTLETNAYPRTFTCDVMGMVTYKHLGMYCRYAPMKIIRADRGPQFSALSVGLILGF